MKDFLDVYLGAVPRSSLNRPLTCSFAFHLRFGLLHRIPSQPLDKIPGSIPPELEEEREEQELFVPADIETHIPQPQDWQANRDLSNGVYHTTDL